jgi:hypothetical protein
MFSPTWGCANCFRTFLAVCRKGLGAGWWPFTGIDPSGSWELKPNGVQVKLPPLKLWQWPWLGGAHGLSGWVSCFFAFNIYTYVFFFIYRSRCKHEFSYFFFCLKILLNVNGKETVWHTPCFHLFVSLSCWELPSNGASCRALGTVGKSSSMSMGALS